MASISSGAPDERTPDQVAAAVRAWDEIADAVDERAEGYVVQPPAEVLSEIGLVAWEMCRRDQAYEL